MSAIMKFIKRKNFILILLFSYSFCLALFLGKAFSVNKSLMASQLVKICLLAVLPALLACAALCLLFHFVKKMCSSKIFMIDRKINEPDPMDWKWGLISFACGLLAWLPILLAYYPGLLNYDAKAQILQGPGNYSNAHPLVHTLFLKFFYNVIGDRIFHNLNIGILLNTIFQMVMMSGAISYLQIFLRRIGTRLWLRILMLLFTSFSPFISLMSISLVKDTQFACAFLVNLVCLCYWELEEGVYYGKKRNLAVYIISIILMCMMRNDGAIVSVVLLICMLIRKGRNCKMIISTIIGIAAYFVLNNILLACFGAAGHIKVNSLLSLEYQQIAYVNNVVAGDITEEERAEMIRFIPDIHLQDLHSADRIKQYARASQDWKGFWKIYFHLFRRFPMQYMEAVLQHDLGFWYIGDTSHADQYGAGSRLGYLPTLQCELGQTERSFIPSLFSVLDRLFSENRYQKNIGLVILCSPATYFWGAVAFGLWNWRRKGFFYPFLFIAARMILLLMSPCVLIRYSMPIMMCVPLLGILCLRKESDR